MSGHSKWHKIKHQKGAMDKKRGALFSKLAKNISIAAREGADPTMNFTLRLAIEKAKSANMPKDNIERAIARGSGQDGSAQLENVVFEILGPGGVALIVEAVTDNNNRTFAEIKTLCNKNGGNMDAKVLWQFERKGVIRGRGVKKGKEEDFELQMIEGGVEDIIVENGNFELVVDISDLQKMEEVVRIDGFSIESAELEYVASQKISVDDGVGEELGNFIDLIEDHEDVNNVFTNVE